MSGDREPGKQACGYGSTQGCGLRLRRRVGGKALATAEPGAPRGPTFQQVGEPGKSFNILQVSTPDVSDAAWVPASHACLQRGRERDALVPLGSPKLFGSHSRLTRVSGVPVPGFSPPRAGRGSPFSGSRSPGQAPLLPGALAPLTPPGGWAGAGPTAGPPPSASRAGRAGGWLGRLHLLFLKRRGADERHHSSPGPSRRSTQRPAFRKRSSSGGGGESSGQAPER